MGLNEARRRVDWMRAAQKGIMKILMWILIAIFLIGLLVVIGAGKLIF